MAIAEIVWSTLEEQEKLVLAIEDPQVTEYAKKIAFYQAMYDAALDDPMELSSDQEEILRYFFEKLITYIEAYQTLVNTHL